MFCPNDVSVINEHRAACETYYDACAHILMNELEAQTLLGAGLGEGTDLLNRLQNDGKNGVITMGEHGAILFTPDTHIHVPTALKPADFVDSNGAGDGFAAGYVYGLERQWSIEKMGRLGAQCAAAVLSVKGARPPADLRARIKETL